MAAEFCLGLAKSRDEANINLAESSTLRYKLVATWINFQIVIA